MPWIFPDSPDSYLALVAAIDRPGFAVQFAEVRPGLGGLDYGVFLRELNMLDPDTPLMLEHLPSQEEYALAGAHLHAVAQGAGLAFR